MSLIIPANTLASGGFAVDNSVRMNDGSTEYFSRTCGSTASSYTVSMWVKTSKSSGSSASGIWWNAATNKLGWELNDYGQIYYYNAGTPKTTGLYRDTSAWYHLVWKVTSNTGTLYVNGAAAAGLTGIGSIASLVSGNSLQIGADNGGGTFDGYMAEVCFIDGTALDPTSFGEFDEDSGIWKPISVSGLTFGTNGFYLDFKDSSALGNDVSGNNNDLTANNLTSIDQSTDTCSTNFATLNPLIQLTDATLSEGNLQVAYGSAGSRAVMLGTFGLSSGKWYCEFKVSASSASPCNGLLGIINGSDNSSMGTYLLQNNSVYQGAGYQFWDGNKNINQVGATFGATIAAGDIVGMAIDMDNKALYFSKNGTYQASGNPASGSSKTGAIDFSSLTDNGFWFIGVSDASGTQTMTYQCNFGSPMNAISSGNTDGNDRGNFEYAPPSGYLSLCTANLSEASS